MKRMTGSCTSDSFGYAAACSASACSVISLITDAIITASVFVVRVTGLRVIFTEKSNKSTPAEMYICT